MHVIVGMRRHLRSMQRQIREGYRGLDVWDTICRSEKETNQVFINAIKMTSEQSNRIRYFRFLIFFLSSRCCGNSSECFKNVINSHVKMLSNRSTSTLRLGLVYGHRGVSTSAVRLVQVPNGIATMILKRQYCVRISKRNSHKRLLVNESSF